MMQFADLTEAATPSTMQSDAVSAVSGRFLSGPIPARHNIETGVVCGLCYQEAPQEDEQAEASQIAEADAVGTTPQVVA